MSDQQLRSDVSSAIAETTQIIHRLHQKPDIGAIAVVYYEELQPFGRYVPGDGSSGHIEVSLFGPHPRLTFAHEVGHLLDQAIVGYTGYASAERFSVLQDIMMAIRDSEAYQQLLLLTSTSNSGFVARLAQRRAVYWLNPEELWARAYAQYIAVRSRNATLITEVGITRSLETHPASAYVQWEENDFAAIEQAIDAVLLDLGWKQ